MNIIYLLIAISVILVVIIAAVFFWAVHSGQYDDLEKQSRQILMDKDEPDKEKEKE